MPVTEPRTEAGRRLLAREAYNSRSFALITAEDILAIEAEAAAGPRETFVGPGGKRIEVKFAEAAAGPREHSHVWLDGELLLNGCALPHEAAAGPRDDNLLRNYLEKLAAGPRLTSERVVQALHAADCEATGLGLHSAGEPDAWCTALAPGLLAALAKASE